MKDDPFRQMQKLMEAAVAPSREIQKPMDDARVPTRQTQKLMENVLGPTRHMQKVIDDALAPSRQMQKVMDDALGPTRQMQKLTDDMLGPTRQSQKLMDDALAPSRQMQKLMEDALGPTRQMQKLMDDVLAPTRQMQKLMNDALAPSREIQDLMDVLAPSRRMQKLMEDVLAPSRQIRKLTDELLTALPQRLAAHVVERPAWLPIETQFRQSAVFKIQEELARGLSGFSQLRAYPEDVLAALRQCAGIVDSEEVQQVADALPEVNPDGSVTLDGEIVGIEEIEGALAAFFAHIREVGSDLALVVGQWRRPIKALIVHVVIPLLINYSVCLYFAAQSSNDLREFQRQVDAQGAATRREVVRATKALVAPREGSLQWRLVTGDALRVRSRPSTRASIETTLRLGTVVRFVEKRGRWTRIQFDVQNTNELVEGWVFNKYLTRVR